MARFVSYLKSKHFAFIIPYDHSNTCCSLRRKSSSIYIHFEFRCCWRAPRHFLWTWNRSRLSLLQRCIILFQILHSPFHQDYSFLPITSSVNFISVRPQAPGPYYESHYCLSPRVFLHSQFPKHVFEGVALVPLKRQG